MFDNTNMVERVEYAVISRSGKVELRRYPRMTLATVEGMGDYDAFRLLFDFINGGNSSARRIAMTTPVMSARGPSEWLPMTSPVVSSARSFSFVMPEGRDADSLPVPDDRRIAIVGVPERTVATLRFRGRARAGHVAARELELLEELRMRGLRPSGQTFLMRYNPPFVPGFLRRNEVGVELKTD